MPGAPEARQGGPPPGAGPGGPFLVSLFTRGQRWRYGLAALAWLGAAVFFWSWWLLPAHNIGAIRFAICSALLGWLTFLQAYFLIFLLQARRPVGDPAGLKGARVAMVVTKSPSEPFDILRGTLSAMLAQDWCREWPHDTWLADEDPAPETLAWCAAHGVRVSTRKGRADYHRPAWPRRTRCKEGNLAFFYDSIGYERYDFVVQLDADHVPQPGYLREMLRPFLDPRVGYVSAPSICSSNAAESWSARARLHAEAAFHGVLQAGYSNGWAPLCIGSHYAVRTRALRQIGGLGPELAEDHSTSLLMNAGGWRGVHAIDAIAIGAGPANFADMLTQEFQWSRSLVTILLRHTPRCLSDLPLRLRLQFLFTQSIYPGLAAFMLAGSLLPAVALVFDMRFVGVTYPAFFGHSLPILGIFLGIGAMLRRDGYYRPSDAPVLGWERVLFPCAQWPWAAWGMLMALRDRLWGGFVDFRITPKGAAAEARLPLRLLAPYFMLAALALAPVLARSNVQEAAGFYLLSLLNGAIYVLLVAAVLRHHLTENRIRLRTGWRAYGPHVGILAVLAMLNAGAVWARGVESLHFLTVGLGRFQVTSAQHVVSGAGQGGRKRLHYVLDFGRSSGARRP
ncbi:glycosyltransferase family 2 protein [Rhodovulum sulfidophilum]|uniref:glycosyltransferase family 2 protein n=1 Tax=Rhodovulum sulfidophilum TaxID=35806 RepID=UPI0009D76961|nr:glycosyltransferase family 2 protein [Rhodovulum sulfidophilum]MBL3551774.1 glycosyltransferase [Rhodovulum sulfidophilum]